MKKMRWESHMEKELALKVKKGSIKTHLHKNFFKKVCLGWEANLGSLSFLSIFYHLTAKLEHFHSNLKTKLYETILMNFLCF